MRDIDEIAYRIAEYQRQIERLEWQIQELLCLPVVDSEGNIVSYADLMSI